MIMRLCTLLRLMSHGSSLDYLVCRSIAELFTLSRTPTTTTTIAAEVLGLARKSRIRSGTFYRKWQIERSLKSVRWCWWSLPTTHQGWSIKLGNPRACHMSPLLIWFRSSYPPVSFSMILSLVGQLKLIIPFKWIP